MLAADPVAGRRTATWKRALDAVETALHGAPPSLWHVSTRRSSPLGSCDAFSESGSRPPSGWVESDASRGSRGALAVPASPSAGLSPTRRRLSRPSPDLACTTGRRRGIAHSFIFSFRELTHQSACTCPCRAPWGAASGLRSLSPQWLPRCFHAAVRRRRGRSPVARKAIAPGDSAMGGTGLEPVTSCL